MKHATPEELLELARGAVAPGRAAELETHTAGCRDCAGELAWAREEARLFSRSRVTATPPPPRQWDSIARRLQAAERASARERRTRAFAWLFGGASLCAGAAALIFWVTTQRPAASSEVAGGPQVAEPADETPELRTASPKIALDDADQNFQRAVDELYAEYQEQRATLPPEVAAQRDILMDRIRADAAALADTGGQGVSSRTRVAHARAAYIRSMQNLVLEEDVP